MKVNMMASAYVQKGMAINRWPHRFSRHVYNIRHYLERGRFNSIKYLNRTTSLALMKDELLSMIWESIGDDRLSTRDASERLDSLFGYRCPDDLAKTLSKYRKEGKIKGEISMNVGGWVWWVDDECRSKGESE
jgi:hypothetical protein